MVDQIPAGWYPDPSGDVNKIRYWDGFNWTDHVSSYIYPAPTFSGNVGYVTPQVYNQPVYQSQDNTYGSRAGVDGLAVASMVLGIAGLFFCFCFLGVSTALGLVGLPLAIVSIRKRVSGIAIAGLVLNIVCCVCFLIAILFIVFNGITSLAMLPLLEEYY